MTARSEEIAKRLVGGDGDLVGEKKKSKGSVRPKEDAGELRFILIHLDLRYDR